MRLECDFAAAAIVEIGSEHEIVVKRFSPPDVETLALQSNEATISNGSWPDTEPAVSGGFGSQAITHNGDGAM